MKKHGVRKWSVLAMGAALAAIVLCAGAVKAQQVRSMAMKQKGVRNSTYDVSREVSVQGTVVKYTENSSTPPIGAHVSIQTSATNTVDVFLGDARLLKQNHFSIAEGNNIRVIGEAVPVGQSAVFVARLVQQGTQVAALRSTNGMPMVFAGNRGRAALQSNAQQGGPR